MIKRGKDPLEIKVERFLELAWKELKIDSISMINWLLFYKPKDKMDKAWHIFEVILVWIGVSKLIFG
jgi:hypothetical protein